MKGVFDMKKKIIVLSLAACILIFTLAAVVVAAESKVTLSKVVFTNDGVPINEPEAGDITAVNVILKLYHIPVKK